MGKPRGPLRIGFEGAAAVAFLAFMSWWPRRAGLALLRGLGSLAWCVLRGRRARARARVERTLGLTRAEADRVVRGAFQSMAQNLLEAGWVARDMQRHGAEAFIDVEGAEHIEAALAEGRGVLCASSHLGAWEASAVVVGHLFRPMWAVARPLDNPWLEKLAVKRRGRLLAGTLEKDGAGRKLLQLMRKGEIVGLLLDQNAGSQGIMLPFLGLPSRHHRAAGMMGARMGAVVVPAYLLRAPGGRYRLIIEPPINAAEGLDREEAERDIVSRVSRSLERQVLAHPEQWLWLHDRWRSAEVVLFQERQKRAEEAKSAPVVADAEGTNGV